MNLRYSELKYEGKIYTEQWKIDEILIKNKFNWMVDAEIKNARLEIFQDTLVWNAGIWYNGDWYFGVWRDGEWRYGTWQNGVWYNGVWRNGTFKSGIIFNGKFFKGKIESGEIRGGQFIDTEISQNVKEYTSDEFQAKQEIQQKQVAVQAQPEPDKVKVHTSQQIDTQPKIQQEKKEYKNMKHLKKFENFITEGLSNVENAGLYDQMNELLNRANVLISNYSEEYPDDYFDNQSFATTPDEALELLTEIEKESQYYDEAQKLYNEIDLLNTEIDEMDAEEYFSNEEDEDETNESVGELEDSFVDINIDETELEDSDRPKSSKLKQKAGIEIIETPSKTDAYNAKMRKGGEVIQEPGFSDKQMHHVKNINDLK